MKANVLEKSKDALQREAHSVEMQHTLESSDEESDIQDSDPILHPSSSRTASLTAQEQKTIGQILLLTLCLAGLQFTWSVEMAYGTPYLLSLGLSKSYMSLVWIAGPLSGLLMQPIVGALSDRCTSRWGRRRPFLVGGSISVVISLIVIGWTREIASLLSGASEGDTFQKVSIGIAIVSIYALDFSINCVQASCRALIVDHLPASQQEQGTAWASRMVGIGNVIGYFMGYVDLVKAFPFLGNSQLKVLCVLASFILLLCDAGTCFSVHERVLPSDAARSDDSSLKALKDIFINIWNLPSEIQRICNVQFFAWMGWFPFLFYSTTWVAEIYDQTALHSSPDNGDALGEATRAGSFAFLMYSIVSLVASFFLPLFVTPSLAAHNNREMVIRFTIRGKQYTLNPSRYLLPSRFTLTHAWTTSHLIFCLAMLGTILVSDVVAATLIIGVCGISWAITMWAPFSLLGEYISKMEESRTDVTTNPLGMHHHNLSSVIGLPAGTTSAGMGIGGVYQLVDQANSTTDMTHEIELQTTSSHHPFADTNPDTGLDIDRTSIPTAGILLGIHNMYIVLPQFLVTFLCSIIFHFLEKDTSSNEASYPNAISIVLEWGGVMAGVAGYMSTKVAV